MVQSMTGYGKASAEINNKKITVEVKSLNSKQFDLSTRVCNLYREKDIEIRNELSQIIGRGKVDFSLYIDNSGKESSVHINPTIVEGYYKQILELSEKMDVPVPEDWFQVLLRMPDVLKSDVQELDENEWKEVKKVIVDAAYQLKDYREQEGKSLGKVFDDKIANIQQLLVDVEKYEGERIDKVKTRLHDNLIALSEKVDYDKNRFEQELIFYIEKLDINEEKVRLDNHLKYFKETMQHEASGKKLGFITQEIGREINTLGSKSNHSEMQKLVVLMKDELEQIKEQVLNVL